MLGEYLYINFFFALLYSISTCALTLYYTYYLNWSYLQIYILYEEFNINSIEHIKHKCFSEISKSVYKIRNTVIKQYKENVYLLKCNSSFY